MDRFAAGAVMMVGASCHLLRSRNEPDFPHEARKLLVSFEECQEELAVAVDLTGRERFENCFGNLMPRTLKVEAVSTPL